VHELLVGVVVAPPRAGDELRLVLWPAHHCGIYTYRGSLVPVTRAVGINHVALEVGDLDEALAFYGRIFELSLRGRHGASMAFVDLGDQFIALSAGREQPPDGPRHVGLVVDDRDAALAAARDAGAELLHDNDFLDPWGNHVQVVDYRDVQFTKTDRILEGMGLAGMGKRPQAVAELRAKGLAD
jgi:catechol 2,3-dioxygenase-like lactoylglutathione lyase family enzyme